MSMSYTAGQGRRLRVDSEALGQSQPWEVTHRGLVYPGEAIVAETVNPAWGLPLEGDTCFRAVLYTVPRRIPAGQIRDPRIAMAVPRRSIEPRRRSVSLEIQAVREASARYVAGGEPGIRSIRDSMAERESSLIAELSKGEARTYSEGRIYTETGATLGPSEVFVEGDTGTWIDSLAVAVLSQAFPTLPFESDEFPDTLTGEHMAAIFRGLFRGDRDAADTTAAFAPPLGLATREAPTRFDANECRVMGLIEEELDSRGGEIPAQDTLWLLSRHDGLNRGLATFYLVAYVSWARAEVELVPGHSVRRRDGGPYRSDRITWDLIPELSYTESLADQLGVLRARPSLTWNSVLPYTSLLVEGLDPSRYEALIAQKKRRLADALEEMGRGIEGVRESIGALSASLGETAQSAVAVMQQLQVLSSAAGYRGLHKVAVDSFGGPSGLEQALHLYDRLQRLAALAPAITTAMRYLDEMTFEHDHQGLALKRDSLVARIGLDSLLANPTLWPSVEDSYNQIRREYAQTYLSHHSRYFREAQELTTRSGRLRNHVDALARFNDVPEFGGPLGVEVPRRFRDLTEALRSCALSEQEVSLDKAPVCQGCQLRLSETVPRREAEAVFAETERAMREYNRRLSSEGVRRILAHRSKDQLEKLISLVQVSDLTALANVLDEEVVDFLQGFIGRG